jgi:tetratricopeptide (TPR) repeat protein
MSEQNTPQTAGQSQLTIDEAYRQALDLFFAENYTEADQLCTAILQAVPSHVYARNLLGLIAQKYNRHDLAVEQFQKAIKIDNSIALLYYNLGTSLYPLGYLDEVVKAQQKAIKIQPDYAEAYSSLGNALSELGILEEAVENCQKAISINPDYADAHYNLGNALKEQEKLKEAVASYQRAISIKPDYVDACSNLGVTLQEQGKLEEAVVNYQKAISINPDYANAYSNLGNVFQEQEKLEEAVASYQKAISINPNNGIYWTGFAQCIKVMNFSHCNEEFFHYLLQMLDQPTVRPNDVSGAVIRSLRHNPKFLQVLTAYKSGNIEKKIGYYTAQLSTIPLLLQVMELSVIIDVGIEKMLTQIRNIMLNNVTTKKVEDQSLPFYAILALHCFINEYVFTESEEEKQKIEKLQDETKNILDRGDSVPPAWIAIIGAYRPLHSLSWSDKLLDPEWSMDINKVIEVQVKEPKEEQAIRSQISRLTETKDTVSQAVRNQYEVNPYPRWVSTSLYNKAKTIKHVLQEIKLHLDFNKQKFTDKPEILIAGCGTGQHTIGTASRFKNCNVLAFDLSLSSLSYGIRKTRELGLLNIEFMQGDILQLINLDRRFDIIESVGVLHHMHDPIAGWKILADILRPNGLMKIGLYSNIARQHIVEARRVIAQKKYTSSSDDIRKFRKEIITMNGDTDLKTIKLLQTLDFYSISTCRDLLFHIQEHRFTLPQIDIALKKLGLKFIGFEIQDSHIMKNFKKTYPEKSATASLSLWNKFEIQNPDIFIGMYQFWVQKI